MKPGTKGAEYRKRILASVRQFKQDNAGISPTVREITKLAEVPSTSLVDLYLRQLQNQGLVQLRGKKQSRSIALVGEQYILPPEAAVR